ncbi:hypothetical protein H6F89_28600 [Cyanobacteria bacterium FACHB-63]|nr:hypothetical protein [Cyanobacteria bacterium FACHB-63]
MDFNEAIVATRIHNPIKVKQPKLWVLCAFQLPSHVAETMSAINLANTRGQFLIGFNFKPSKGDHFPWNGHIWKTRGEVMQFPARYNSRGRKDAPYVVCEYVESYADEMQMFVRMLELSSNI